MNERQAFLKALDDNEDDVATRLVYADWLDDGGEHEEADRQGKWPAAKEWLREFARQIPDFGGVEDEEEPEEDDSYTARRRVYGDETAEETAWVESLLHTLQDEGYERAFESVDSWRTGLQGQKRKAATKLLNYIVERRDMINSPEFVEKGWLIGSGPTEARCKTSTARLKQFGQRWDMCHADEIAALGNLRDSGQWKDY